MSHWQESRRFEPIEADLMTLVQFVLRSRTEVFLAFSDILQVMQHVDAARSSSSTMIELFNCL